MSRCLRLSLASLAFLLCSISMVAQVAPQLYWQLYVDPDGATGFPNIVWFDLDGLPGPPPVPANIPIPAGAWSPQGGERTMDAVQAPGQPGLLFLLTSTELRAFRINGGDLPPLRLCHAKHKWFLSWGSRGALGLIRAYGHWE